MNDPIAHRVWAADNDEASAAHVIAMTPIGAVLMWVAELVDDNEFQRRAAEDEPSEADWLVREPNGIVTRYRMRMVGATKVGIVALRTCRVCGCTDDRACLPPCSWVDETLCSACAKPAAERVQIKVRV